MGPEGETSVREGHGHSQVSIKRRLAAGVSPVRSSGKGIPGLLVLQTRSEKSLVDGVSARPACQSTVGGGRVVRCGWERRWDQTTRRRGLGLWF